MFFPELLITGIDYRFSFDLEVGNSLLIKDIVIGPLNALNTTIITEMSTKSENNDLIKLVVTNGLYIDNELVDEELVEEINNPFILNCISNEIINLTMLNGPIESLISENGDLNYVYLAYDAGQPIFDKPVFQLTQNQAILLTYLHNKKRKFGADSKGFFTFS